MKRRKHSPSICSRSLRHLMIEKDVTPLQMSFDLMIGRDKIYFWLRGDTLPKLEEAVKLADYFEVSLDEICGREAK